MRRPIAALLLAIAATSATQPAVPPDSRAPVSKDDGTALGKQRCKQKRASNRRACVQAYLEKKRAATGASDAGATATSRGKDVAECPAPSDSLSEADSLRMAQCLHGAELAQPEWLREHILREEDAGTCSLPAMPPGRDSVRARCLLHAGNANWTATGLVDGRPECGRAWLRTGCARRLFSGRDALFIGNSVIRRQMYTVLDLLAGPAARRLQGSTEFVPKLGHRDSFPLSDPLLMSQHGVLNPKTTQSALPGGASRWSREALVRTRMWDRDGDPDAYHAAQLVTIDLDTGEHRFARPHALCGIGDAHMKFGSNRNMQWRAPGLGPGAGRGSILSQGWRSTKYAGREWRPLVSFRIDWPPSAVPNASCADGGGGGVSRAIPRFGSMPGAMATHPNDGGAAAAAVRAAVLRLVTATIPRLGVGNVSVHLEMPSQPRGPNAWVLFPNYHGERERFNGFCEDKPQGQSGACECSGKVSPCTHKFCRGKHECKPLGARGETAVHVEAARSFAAALAAAGSLLVASDGQADGRADGRAAAGGSYKVLPSSVRASVLYDDCWEKRGRCQGFRPCPEPGDQMLACRATALLCGGQQWRAVLAAAKQWIPLTHRSASFLYLFDGASSDMFDETFRTWGPESVGYGSSPIIFGPQFASAASAQLAHSIGLITSAVRQSDAVGSLCSPKSAAAAAGGTKATALIFRSPAL